MSQIRKPVYQWLRKRKRCFKNRYSVEKVYGSICDNCPKQDECYRPSS